MWPWLKQRITAVALAAASTIIFLEFITPAVFDFIFDLMLLGLIAVVGWANKPDQK
jgi:hypothetical protein